MCSEALDRLLLAGALCYIFDKTELPRDKNGSMPAEYLDQQSLEIENLKQLLKDYDEECVYVRDEVWPNDSRDVELDIHDLDAKLLNELSQHLSDSSSSLILIMVFTESLTFQVASNLARLLCVWIS